jgi:hypothetical protein
LKHEVFVLHRKYQINGCIDAERRRRRRLTRRGNAKKKLMKSCLE